jgi:hypothetical protein
VLTPSGLARADPATARITATIRIGYTASTMSAPALIMDSEGRMWVTGALLAVAVPDTLTAYPVAHTADAITAAVDGPTIWVDSGGTLVGLQVHTPPSDRCCADPAAARRPTPPTAHARLPANSVALTLTSCNGTGLLPVPREGRRRVRKSRPAGTGLGLVRCMTHEPAASRVAGSPLRDSALCGGWL